MSRSVPDLSIKTEAPLLPVHEPGKDGVRSATSTRFPVAYNRPLHNPYTQKLDTRTDSLPSPSGFEKSPSVYSPQSAKLFRHRKSQDLGGGPRRYPSRLGSSFSSNPSRSNTMGEPPAETAPEPGKIWQFYEKNKGLAYVLLAQVFGTLMNVTTRILEIEGNKGLGMHPFQILFVRMTITIVLCTFYMWWAEIPNFPFGIPEVRWLLVLRGIGGFFGVFGMYYSLLFLPLADATVLTFIAPVVSCFACAMLLGEPFTRMEQVGALVSFLGVTLIARPTAFFRHTAPQAPAQDATGDSGPGKHTPGGGHSYDAVTSNQRLIAVLVGLIGVLGSAMAFTTMRWIGKRAHPLLSVNYFSVCCCIVAALAMAVLPSIDFILPADAKEWAYLIFLGVCGFTMQTLLSAGLQRERSSRATNMVYTQMLFALIFDKLVFGTNPSVLSMAGSILILSSAIYIALQKQSMKQKEEEERARQESATSSGRTVEMQSTNNVRDEERGLMSNVDEADEPEVGLEQNGHTKGGGSSSS